MENEIDVENQTETTRLGDLLPKIGDLVRLGKGATALYYVSDFKLSIGIQTMAKSAGGKVSTSCKHVLSSRDPKIVEKAIHVTVVEEGRKRYSK